MCFHVPHFVDFHSAARKTFTVLSLHISNIYAKKDIAKKLILIIRAIMIGQQIDLVASDFNGTAWRCRNKDHIKYYRRSLCRLHCQRRRALHHCGDPVQFPNKWADVCGFLKPPGSDRCWKVRMHGAFSILHKTLGLRPTDQSCHHETWLHLDFFDWRNSQSHHEEPDRRILLKERPTPYQYGQRSG